MISKALYRFSMNSLGMVSSLLFICSSALFIFSIAMFICPSANAIVTEVGINYGHKKTSLDAANFSESESTTGSVSFYIADRIALEFSYTEANAVQNQVVGSDTQIVTQTTTVTGGDLILILAPPKSLFQPYIKGGGAQIKRFQKVKVNSLNTYTVEPETAMVPSYGAGLKIALTEAFGIKLSYDVWKTPIGNGVSSEDTNFRAGVTWML